MSVRAFLLPDLGEGLEDAEIVTWRVAEGERVELNQTLVEVNTAKALVEVPSPWTGVVRTLHATEGEVVAVGKPLVSIDVPEAGEPADTGAGPRAVAAAEPDAGDRRPTLVGYGAEPDAPAPAARTAQAPAAGGPARREGGAVAATPPVRKLAREMGVDLSGVSGTGPDGRITREDVLAAGSDAGAAKASTTRTAADGAGAAAVSPDDVDVIPVRGTRRMIAEHLSRSVREIPHVTTFLTLDASWLQAFRKEVEDASGRRVSPLPIVVRALAEVCRQFPALNASFDAERSEIRLHRGCHVGIATDTDDGLIVPVVRDVGAIGIVEIAERIAQLAEAARAGRIAPADLSGGTITVTNVGTFGAEFGTPIINHPQGAILALGVIEPRALVVGGQVVPRPAATLSLAFDHRLLDGAQAGRALKALGDFLESPFKLGSLPR
ncbi:MAG TPA: dihydrolipoamide acetyltransferase family protein [Actinomycetota bacterium]|jgi:pyruvate dehydrogenase E2 component (dihydrolipoamide acetyltransferase)